MKAELAIELFGSKSLPIAPLFDIGSTGFQFGIGNQFNWDNGFTLGIDWVSIYLPYFSKTKNTEIFSLLDQTARDDANKIVDLIYNLPIIELFKVQLNYSF